MNLISRFGDIFQPSYATKDRDRAVAFASAKLGMDNFFCFDAKVPGVLQDLELRVVVANIRNRSSGLSAATTRSAWG